MRPIEEVMATLLETWNQRYTFSLDRKKWELRLSVPGFEMLVTETADQMIAIAFEEAGVRHRAECTPKEAPKVIEALLIPEE